MRPRGVFLRFFSLFFLAIAGCGAFPGLSVLQSTPLVGNPLLGDTAPVRDPSIFYQAGVYYLFSTDIPGQKRNVHLPIRCSLDGLSWKVCGQVFTQMPDWIAAKLPGIDQLWAPDISYFDGLYHVYYVASVLHTQSSVIGLATNTTLDPSNPSYQWVDRGEVLTSHAGDDYNALDPNIFVDRDQRIWLTYGSYWTGIKQREIEPDTGLLATNTQRFELAGRPFISDHAEEGASLIQHGNYYYLFLSVDHCCEDKLSDDDYKQIVGRSSSPHGPFIDAAGVPLLQGGGSILIEGNNGWNAPGGGTVYHDPQSGNDILVFHAMQMNHHAQAGLWIKRIGWVNGWPMLYQVTTTAYK